MKRRILLIIIVILAGVGLYLGRGYIFKSGTLPTQVETEPGQDELGATPAGQQDEVDSALQPLTATTVFDYWVDQGDRTVYFLAGDGSVYRMHSAGNPEEVFSGISDVSSVAPAPKGISALIEAGYPDNQFFSIINPTARSRQFLPLGTVAAAWNPDATQVAFLKEGDSPSLNIFTVATAKSRLITNLNMADVQLTWKTNSELYISQRPSAGIPGSVWAYDLNRRTMRTVVSEVPGLTVKWINQTQGLVFFNVASSPYGKFAVLSSQTGEMSGLPILTLPDKCTVELSAVYCAEPSTLNGSSLPDDYYQRKPYITDNIVSMDLNGGKLRTVFSGISKGAGIDGYHLLKVGSSLYFINRNDNKLYSLAL